MVIPVLAVTIVMLYFGAAILQSMRVMGKYDETSWSILVISFAAVTLHAALLYHWIDLGHVQNLSFYNLLSLVTWLISVLVLLAILIVPLENLTIFVFPLAGISVLLVLLLPTETLIDTANNPAQLIHILLSTLTLSVMMIAGLQALLLFVQEHFLRKKELTGLLLKLPPVETMEKLLFQLINIGFVLLTVLLVSSNILFDGELITPHKSKLIVSIAAWVVFLVLLLARTFLGWRGRKAIRLTVIGVVLLIIVYFGSHFA